MYHRSHDQGRSASMEGGLHPWRGSASMEAGLHRGEGAGVVLHPGGLHRGGGVGRPPLRYMGYYELILSAKYSHQLRWVFLQLLLLVHLLIRLNELADAEKKIRVCRPISITIKHSSRMRTARLLTVSGLIVHFNILHAALLEYLVRKQVKRMCIRKPCFLC